MADDRTTEALWAYFNAQNDQTEGVSQKDVISAMSAIVAKTQAFSSAGEGDVYMIRGQSEIIVHDDVSESLKLLESTENDKGAQKLDLDDS